MRTKTLLTAAAALLAAGLVSSQAQVYSQNIVGYVTQTYPTGFSLVTTPLATSNNVVTEVMQNAPVGTAVYTFSGGAYAAGNTYYGSGIWGDNNQVLAPGTGYFVQSPSPWTNIVVGTVVQFSTNSLVTGFNLVGSAYPMAGAIDTDLGLAPAVGDSVYTFSAGAYSAGNTYYGSAVWGNGAPTVNVGQGFFYQSTAANSWVQSFPSQ